MFGKKSKEIANLRFQISTLHDCINQILKQSDETIAIVKEQNEKEWLQLYDENKELKKKIMNS